MREDYSPHGNAWENLPHDHARSRAAENTAQPTPRARFDARNPGLFCLYHAARAARWLVIEDLGVGKDLSNIYRGAALAPDTGNCRFCEVEEARSHDYEHPIF